MGHLITRRDALRTMAAAGCLAAVPGGFPAAQAGGHAEDASTGWVTGHLTGAQALVETLMLEGTDCVFGIPGAQENEVWDTMKSKGLPYLLCTHEFSAACM